MPIASRSLAACMLLALSALNVSNLQAQPTPTDAQCMGILTDRHMIRWAGVGGDIVYEIHQRIDDEDWECINCDDLAGPLSPDSSGVFLGEVQFDVPDSSSTYRYRVRAVDPEDDSKSGYSDIVKSPTWSTGPDFRVFYNVDECPEMEDGGTNCLSNPSAADFLSDVASGSLTRFAELGFSEFSFSEDWDRYPINMKDCDGVGCARSWGIALSPEFFDVYDHGTNVGKPESVGITVHELFHKIQGAYGTTLQTDPAVKWVREAQARAIQDIFCVPIGGDDCVNVDDDPNGSASFHGELNDYLDNTNQPITEISYDAAIFWTYLCEHFGNDNVEPERGIDFIRRFWEEARDGDEDRDGIQVLDALLEPEDSSFEEAFRDFAVVNYTKTFSNVSQDYKYYDESPNQVDAALEIDELLTLNTQIGPEFSDVQHWGVKYFEVTPISNVPDIHVEATVQTDSPVSFALIAIRNNEVVEDIREVTKDFSHVLVNEPGQEFSRVCLVVAGLEDDATFFYSFNATGPNVTLLQPSESQPEYVGIPSSPEKFVAVVQVVSQNANAVLGLDPEDFSFTVGAAPVTDVVQSFYAGGGQYWFVLQAPDQASTGSRSLRVEWSTLVDTEPDSVEYGDTASDPSANAITIDRTPSMIDPGSKLSAARASSRIYVDSFKEGDKVAVVGFSGDNDGGCESETHFGLQDWSEQIRQDANDEIVDITASVPGGRTSVGAGLLQALEELDKDEGESPVSAIFLMSDGDNNCGEDIEDFLVEWNSRKSAGDPVPEVHTLAIGNDAERTLLENLSDETGGNYNFVPDPPPAEEDDSVPFRFGMIDIHRTAAVEIAREQQNFGIIGDSQLGKSPLSPILVDAGATELTVQVSWPGQKPASIVLADPDGITNYLPAHESSRHVMFKVDLPTPGTWSLFVVGVGDCSLDCGTRYIADASVTSSLEMIVTLGLPRDERIVGTPVPILAAISDTSPIPGAVVLAQVRNPLDQDSVIQLFDDGAHADGAANDGVYGNAYFPTYIPGSYRAQIIAVGNTPILGDFGRRKRIAFHMRDDDNRDGDCTSRRFPWGMPAGWEKKHGLDPSSNDGSLDPDGDGIDNCGEYERGTDPNDPDTDDDGESDGSEDEHGRDPRDPSDGVVDPPRIVCYPKNRAVEIRYTIPRGAFSMQIWRAVGAGPFGIIADSVPLRTVVGGGRAQLTYLDRRVVNDEIYRYKLVAKTRDNARSRFSLTCTVSPKHDPYPPFGSLRINDGASSTDSVFVRLRIHASDVPDPEDEDSSPTDTNAAVSGVADMQVSNFGDFADAAWVPYEQHLENWELDPQDGNPAATVFARFRDGAGNVSETVHCTIRLSCVTGDDTTPPTLSVPRSVVTESCSPDGVRVEFEVTAKDGCSDVDITCNPASGSLFPLGDTRVVCSAADEAGNIVREQFIVRVNRSRQCDGTLFKRGDTNIDGGVDISDPIEVLNYLFLGQAQLRCEKSADFDDSGALDITDAIAQLGYLFLGKRGPPAPGLACGRDPTPDQLTCDAYDKCP